MYTAIVYGKSIKGKTITELRRKASRIANDYYNVIDHMYVTYENGMTSDYIRVNKKCPNNTIERGQWK